MHLDTIPSQGEVLQIFRKAGFRALTPLQEKIIPLILRGKDIAAETPPGSGRTTGFVLPLIIGLRGAGPAPRAAILVPAAEDVGKVARAYARLSRVLRDAPSFIPLGEIDDVRKEQRRLEKGFAVVAGTVERVIDHIRRESLRVEQLDTVVVEAPEGEARESFTKDLQFIFARLTARRQTVLFSKSPMGEKSELLALLHRPVVIDGRGYGAGDVPERGYAAFETAGRDKPQLLARILLARRISPALIFHSPRVDAEKIARTLRRSSLQVAVLHPPGRRRAPTAYSLRELDALLVPLTAGAPTHAELEELGPSSVVYYDLPSGGVRVTAAARELSGVIALVDSGQDKELIRLQEAVGAAMKKEDIPSDDELIAGSIERILAKAKEQKGRNELAILRSRIRRQVPLLLRPWFMAYLLKSQLSDALGRPAAPGGVGRQGDVERQGAAQAGRRMQQDKGREPVSQDAARAAGAPAGVPQGPRGRFGRFGESLRSPTVEPRPERDGEFTQLFVSIGRNRKVFARDLIELFTEKLHLAAGDIRDVRVFEKYSFVDIVHRRAEEAIAKLSGSQLKGRTIAVNYAKKKEEKKGR